MAHPQISNFVKICPVGAELFHVNRRHEADVAFCSFANVAENPT